MSNNVWRVSLSFYLNGTVKCSGAWICFSVALTFVISRRPTNIWLNEQTDFGFGLVERTFSEVGAEYQPRTIAKKNRNGKEKSDGRQPINDTSGRKINTHK